MSEAQDPGAIAVASMQLISAIGELLIKKGVITAVELRGAAEAAIATNKNSINPNKGEVEAILRMMLN